MSSVSASSSSSKAANAPAEEEDAADVDGDEDLDGKVRYCVCQDVFDEERSMVECDTCGEWYHLSCPLKWSGVLIFEHEVPAGDDIFSLRQAECKDKDKFTLEELREWGGTVIDVKVDESGDTPETLFMRCYVIPLSKA